MRRKEKRKEQMRRENNKGVKRGRKRRRTNRERTREKGMGASPLFGFSFFWGLFHFDVPHIFSFHILAPF